MNKPKTLTSVDLFACVIVDYVPKLIDNLMGTIDLNTMSIMTREYETINGSAAVDFLKAIEAALVASTKVHVIADGGYAHTSKEVGLFLTKASAVNRLFLDETYGIK